LKWTFFDFIDIREIEILQISATIIAGALIFLTLTSFSIKPSISIEQQHVEYVFISIIYGIGIIIDFSLVSILAILRKKGLAMAYMFIGFILLILVGLILVTLNLQMRYSESLNPAMKNQSNMNVSKINQSK